MPSRTVNIISRVWPYVRYALTLLGLAFLLLGPSFLLKTFGLLTFVAMALHPVILLLVDEATSWRRAISDSRKQRSSNAFDSEARSSVTNAIDTPDRLDVLPRIVRISTTSRHQPTLDPRETPDPDRLPDSDDLAVGTVWISPETGAFTILSDVVSQFIGSQTSTRLSCDITTILNQALEPWFVQAPQTVSFLIAYDVSAPIVRANPVRLVRAFSNLIAWAIQSIPHGGQVQVSATSPPATHASEVSICIAVTGSDIRDCDPDTLFTPHRAAGDTDARMGLATSSRIIKDIGGELEADVLTGQSITFTVKLPSRIAARTTPQTGAIWFPMITGEPGSDG